MNYDLEERTLAFSRSVIIFLKSLKLNHLNSSIINQLLRSTTSVGANYREANNASSRKDFTNKAFICKKECQETKYWIELLAELENDRKSDLRKIWQEAHELTLIFNKICYSSKKDINH
jgi:four helix bundle protein